MTSTQPPVTTLFEERELRARVVGRVVVLAWHEAPRAATIEQLKAKVAVHHDAHPEGVAIVILSRGGPPDDSARAAFRELVRAVERSVAGIAVLVPMRGIRGAIVRRAISGVVLALNLPFAVKVLETPHAAASHIDGLLRARRLETCGVDALERVIVDVQSPLSP